MSKHVNTCQTCSNLSKLVQTCPKLFSGSHRSLPIFDGTNAEILLWQKWISFWSKENQESIFLHCLQNQPVKKNSAKWQLFYGSLHLLPPLIAGKKSFTPRTFANAFSSSSFRSEIKRPWFKKSQLFATMLCESAGHHKERHNCSLKVWLWLSVRSSSHQQMASSFIMLQKATAPPGCKKDDGQERRKLE